MVAVKCWLGLQSFAFDCLTSQMVFLFGGQSLLAGRSAGIGDWSTHASHLHMGVGCSHTAAGLRERAKDKHYKKPGGKLQDFL